MDKLIQRYLNFVMVLVFIFTSLQVQTPAAAQGSFGDGFSLLTNPGVMVHLSPEFTPAFLKGLIIHPENPLNIDFLISPGDEVLNKQQKHDTYQKLVKYFLASLAVPDDDQWVNLSPYEKDRIIKDNFGKTEMGRDLLAQDYILKQITASLIYPEERIGKEFWDKVYDQAQKEFGTTNIPINTFNKVWIIPDEAYVYEHDNMVYVVSQHLKVMLEEDYLSLTKHTGITHAPLNGNLPGQKTVNKLGNNLVRAVVLPALQKEINEGKNFANLRQVYSAMILSAWYKHSLKESFLGKIYANKAKVKGVDQDPANNVLIYKQYLRAFKKGVFNYIKEDVDKYSHEIIPRKYFSGGMKNPGRRYFEGGLVKKADGAMVMQDSLLGGLEVAVVNAFLIGTAILHGLTALTGRSNKEQLPFAEVYLPVSLIIGNANGSATISDVEFLNKFVAIAARFQGISNVRIRTIFNNTELSLVSSNTDTTDSLRKKVSFKEVPNLPSAITSTSISENLVIESSIISRLVKNEGKIDDETNFLNSFLRLAKALLPQESHSSTEVVTHWNNSEYRYKGGNEIIVTKDNKAKDSAMTMPLRISNINPFNTFESEPINPTEQVNTPLELKALMERRDIGIPRKIQILYASGFRLNLISQDKARAYKTKLDIQASITRDLAFSITKITDRTSAYFYDFIPAIVEFSKTVIYFPNNQDANDRVSEKRHSLVAEYAAAITRDHGFDHFSQWINSLGLKIKPVQASKVTQGKVLNLNTGEYVPLPKDTNQQIYEISFEKPLRRLTTPATLEDFMSSSLVSTRYVILASPAMNRNVDHAAVVDPNLKGGIDFNAAQLNLFIKRDGKGIPLPISQQDMASLSNLEGLDPVIVDIRPARTSPEFAKIV